MTQQDVPISPPARRLSAVVGLILIAVAALGATGPSVASAAFVSGQQEAWSQVWGTGEGEFFNPAMLAVDPENGNVFVSDLLPTFEGSRVQEFTKSGELIAETEPITTVFPGEFAGMAMDPETDELYLLEASSEKEIEPGLQEEIVATRILAFDATPSAGTKRLPAAADPEIEVPQLGQPDTLFNPRELTLDPKTGQLIVLAENRQRQTVIQRIGTTGTGTIGDAYIDTSEKLAAQAIVGGRVGLAISEDGTTYVGSWFENVESGVSVTHFQVDTLPPEFTATSTLNPVPGFDEAATVESWSERFIFAEPTTWVSNGYGPQLAVSSAPDGSGETLYFKVEAQSGTETTPGQYYVRAYSLAEGATTAVYGGGPEGECGIQAQRASLATEADGSLLVLDQGGQVQSVGSLPSYQPWVMRFGPDAVGACPVPAAAFKLESRGRPVTEVNAGRTVTLNGESELAGHTLAQTTWQIKGPENVTETVAGPTQAFRHKFGAEGSYTVRMKIEVPRISSVGTTFWTKLQRLVVMGTATEFPLTVTKSGTGTGTVTSIPAEIDCGTLCSAEFEESEEVELIPTAAAGSEFAGWSGACAGTEICKVPMSAAESVGAVFSPAAPPAPEFTLKITSAGSGAVRCNGGACAGKYPAGTHVTLTASPGSGSVFAGWSGAGCTGTGICVVTIEADTAVTATFNAAPPSGGNNNTNPGGGGNSTNPGGPNSGGSTTSPPPAPHGKTAAQKLKEKKQEAVAKCKKMKGKSKAKCLKKANEIGKPKKKKKTKTKMAAHELVRGVRWDAL